jgi:hypothetical protein
VALIAGRKQELFERILAELPAAFKKQEDFPEVKFEYAWDNFNDLMTLCLWRETEFHTRARISQRGAIAEKEIRVELWLRHTSLDYAIQYSGIVRDPDAQAIPILMEILTVFFTTQNIPLVEATSSDTSEARTWQVTPGGGYRTHFGCVTIQL